MGSGSAGSTGQAKPATKGESYGRQVFEDTNNPESIFALGTDSLSVFIQAHPDNSGRIFLGFDDAVDSNTGIVLEAGDTISISLDLDEQNLWGLPVNANDEVRFMVLS